MRKYIILASLLLSGLALYAQDYSRLDSLMDVYTNAMRPEANDLKTAEVDFMISAAQDSLTRQHIALYLFDYYRESPLMGEEAVAVHIYDEWFAGGKVAMRGEIEEMDAKLFADFNRSSLIGNQAPELRLRKPCNGTLTLPRQGRTTMLWFFDTSCSKCRLEAQVLPEILRQEASLPVDFCAVYCGRDKKEWKAFRKSFKVNSPNVKVIHAWDPEIDSDYLRLYGVISTPKIYMIDSRGVIIGRRLEPDSFPQIFELAGKIENIYRN